MTKTPIAFPKVVYCMTDKEIAEGEKVGAGHGIFIEPDTIKINPYMNPLNILLNYVHEHLHMAFPDASEDLVDALTEIVAVRMGMIWKGEIAMKVKYPEHYMDVLHQFQQGFEPWEIAKKLDISKEKVHTLLLYSNLTDAEMGWDGNPWDIDEDVALWIWEQKHGKLGSKGIELWKKGFRHAKEDKPPQVHLYEGTVYESGYDFLMNMRIQAEEGGIMFRNRIKIRDLVKPIDTRNLSMYPMSIPGIQGVVDVVEYRLQELNDNYNTNVGITYLTLQDLQELQRWHPKIKPTTQGFVDHTEPWNIYMVPENILSVDDAVNFINHEYEHVLDVTCEPGTAYCPVGMRTDDEFREERARQAEKLGSPLHPIRISAKKEIPPQSEAIWDEEMEALQKAIEQKSKDPIFKDTAQWIDEHGDQIREHGVTAEEIAKSTGHTKEQICLAMGTYSALTGEMINRVITKLEGIGISMRNPDFPVGRDALLGAMANMAHAEAHLINILPDLARKIRQKRKEIERFMWGDTDDGIIVKDCPFCALKHLLVSYVYLIEAPSFGAEGIPVEAQELFEIVQEIDTILQTQQDFAKKFLVV